MWPNRQEKTDLVLFTEEIFNGRLNLSRSVSNRVWIAKQENE